MSLVFRAKHLAEAQEAQHGIPWSQILRKKERGAGMIQGPRVRPRPPEAQALRRRDPAGTRPSSDTHLPRTTGQDAGPPLGLRRDPGLRGCRD